MTSKNKMQARSSTSGALVTWLSATRDFAGSGFPGPGTAQDVAVASKPSGPGAPSRRLSLVAFVDPLFAGVGDGTEFAPFATVAAALSGTTGPIVLLLAPGDYSEAAIALPADRPVKFQAVTRGSVVFDNKVTCFLVDDSFFEFEDVEFLGGFGLRDSNAGTGHTTIVMTSCFVSSITNENPGAAAYSHKTDFIVSGKYMTPELPSISPSCDMTIAGAMAINGNLDGSLAYFYVTNGVKAARLRGCRVGGNAHWSDSSVVVGTSFAPGMTLTLPGGVHIYADRLSKYYLTGITISGGTGSVDLLD